MWGDQIAGPPACGRRLMPKILRGARRQRYRARRDRFFVACIRGFRTGLGWVGARRAVRIGAGIGSCVPWILPKPRATARAQLAKAFPELSDRERERILRQMFRGLGCSMAEIILMDEIADHLDEWVGFEGLEVLDRALAQGRGVIAVTGHIGNWELLAAGLGLKKYPLTAIATPVKGDALNQENIDLRRRVGVETVPRDGAGAAKAILRTLRSGRILGILMDQDTQGQGVVVPFFGMPAYTPVGPAVLAWRTGAAVVAIFIHRGEDGRHAVRVRDLALPDREAVGEQGRASWQEEATAVFNLAIEQEIRERPDEWVWWHERWRRGTRQADS